MAQSSLDSPGALAVFLEASAALLTSTSLDQTLSIIVQLTDRLLSADASAIWRMDARTVRVVSSIGLSDEYLQQSEVTFPEGLAELEDMIIPDVQAHPVLDHVRSRYGAEGICSLLVLTLSEGSAPFGTLTLYYKTPHNFDEDEVIAARTLANLSSAAITAAALTEREALQKDDLARSLEATRQAELRFRLINNAGQIFGESLDYNLTLDNLTKAIVPDLADWCAVHLLEGDELRQVALAHIDAAKLERMKQMMQRFPVDPDAANGVHNVVRSGRTVVVNDLDDAAIGRFARGEEHWSFLREMGIRSYIAVPLRTRTAVIGALTLIRSTPERAYDAADQEVVEELGRRAGLAVEKARLYEESQSARAELERSNQAKDEFLGMVSHELRTPLSGVYGSVLLLLTKGELLSEADRQDLLEGIKTSSTRMIDLVEDLLLLARLELTETSDQTQLDIPLFLDEVLKPFREGTRTADVDYRAALTSIRAPERLLRQVMVNLLDNADKYSSPETPIEIVVEDEGEGLLFRVLDRGPGVDASELALIFESFHRARQTAHLPGKGLGLSITRRILEALDGRVWAVQRPGGGLEIRFLCALRQSCVRERCLLPGVVRHACDAHIFLRRR